MQNTCQLQLALNLCPQASRKVCRSETLTGRGEVGSFLDGAQLKWVLSSENHELENGSEMCF